MQIQSNTIELLKSRKQSAFHNLELPTTADTEPHRSSFHKMPGSHPPTCTRPWKHIYTITQTCIFFLQINTLSTPSIISIRHSAGKDILILLQCSLSIRRGRGVSKCRHVSEVQTSCKKCILFSKIISKVKCTVLNCAKYQIILETKSNYLVI